jgi:hypothetical protein
VPEENTPDALDLAEVLLHYWNALDSAEVLLRYQPPVEAAPEVCNRWYRDLAHFVAVSREGRDQSQRMLTQASMSGEPPALHRSASVAAADGEDDGPQQPKRQRLHPWGDKKRWCPIHNTVKHDLADCRVFKKEVRQVRQTQKRAGRQQRASVQLQQTGRGMGPDDDGSWPQIPGDYLPEGQGSLDTTDKF